MDYYLEKGRQTFSNMFSSPPPVQYHGLLNQGATCYLNSVLQVLFMTEDFREAVERHCCENCATECIDRHLKALFDDLKGQTAYTYNITKKLGIDRVYEQQDAAEYYEKILGLTSSDASQIFHGWLTDRTTCSACGTETDTDGAFWHLPLALVDSHSEHYSVVDGIKKHFRASEFSGENQMYCEKCDAKCDATIQCVMKHHPEVLMLLLKRFDFDYRYMTYVKINQTVDVPRTLQMQENQTYELYAVVDHIGDLRSGHYTSTIWDDENWFNFNDSRVTLADYQPFQEANFEKSCSAYLLFYRKKNATQPRRAVSAPGGHQPATSGVYDQCKDGGMKRGREEGEAIDRYEGTERVRSRGVVPRHYVNSQDNISLIHQVCNEQRNDKNHVQDTQAEEHREEVGILTGDEEGKGGNAEAEHQAEEMKPVCRVTQREQSVDDQDSGKESAPDVGDDLKPEIGDVLAKDVERGDEERGVMDVKTGEKEKEGKSLMNYPEDNARENIDENLRCTQEVGHDNVLKPVSEDEQRDERGLRTDDEDGKTEAGEREITSEIGRLNPDLFSSEIQENGRDGSRKQNMLKDHHQHGEERMDVQEVEEQKRGDDKQPQWRDTSVTERFPSEGVQAQDSDSGRRDDVSVHPKQKISITPAIQKNVELDNKGKTEVHGGGILLTKCQEGGHSRHEGHEQERGVRRDVKGVTEQKRGDSEHPHFGQNVEDQRIVELDDRQTMSEQRISGTYTSHKDVGAETQSKHIRNRLDSSRKRAGSARSSKPTEYQGADRGEKVRRRNSQERPGSKNIEVKMIDKEIRSGTVARSSVFSDLRHDGGRKPTENQGAGRGEQERRSNSQERPGSKNIEIEMIEKETSAEGNLPKRFAWLKVSESPPKKPKKRANQEAVGNAQQEETRPKKKQKLSDTEDPAEKKRSWFSSFLRRKHKEKRKKKKTTIGCFPFLCKRRENVDSD